MSQDAAPAAEVPRRRAYEAGHTAKFLIVADGTPEFDRALYFAARRAARTGANVVVLAVTPPVEQQEWIGVADLMRAEAEEKARRDLALASERVAGLVGLTPETVLRSGVLAEEMVRLIGEDEDIAILVLGAGTGGEGPGPLVSSLAGKGAARFPVPVVIVPGHLGDPEIEAMT
jgi:nucleotide-binding universal stress UspA family protein